MAIVSDPSKRSFMGVKTYLNYQKAGKNDSIVGVGTLNVLKYVYNAANTVGSNMVQDTYGPASKEVARLKDVTMTKGYPYPGSLEDARKNSDVYKGGSNKAGTAKASDLSSNNKITDVLDTPDETYKWNLPPHAWSLPLDPSRVNPDSVKAVSDENAFHSNRRGKIFLGRKNVGATTIVDSKTGKPVGASNKDFQSNHGFQFMWNPETFNQSTSVNWGITPDQNDATSGLTGLVSANSTLSLTLRLDRTNDFAASKALDLVSRKASSTETVEGLNYTEIAKNYRVGQPVSSGADFANNMNDKIKDLLTRGTEADLEYLYRTINGSGWSSFGIETSNLSYLMPTVVRLDLGPYKMVGMVQSIAVTHLAFTSDMIPIRSDVAIVIDLRANTQYATSNTTGNNVPGNYR